MLIRLGSTRLGMSLRSLLRRSVLGRKLLRRVSMGVSRDFEQHVHEAMIGAIRAGDIVWDIGGHIGHYTQIFLEKAGPTGFVVAIEPAPVNVEQIRKIDPQDGRLTIVQAAISDARAPGRSASPTVPRRTPITWGRAPATPEHNQCGW